MLRSGFGARTAKSIASTSAGRQTISDRGKGANSVIRAIAGNDMAVWLDADDIAAATGEKLGTWTAKIGTGPDQSVSNNQPYYQPGGFNNRPAVQFDDDPITFLYWTNGALNASNHASNTIASVSMKTGSEGGGSAIFELGNPNYWNNTDGITAWYLTSSAIYHGLGDGDDSFEENSTSDSPNLFNAFVGSYRRDTVPDMLSGSLNGEPIVVRENPVEKHRYSDGDASVTNWTGESCHLGARVSGGPSGGTPSFPMYGYMREFIVLNRAITIGESCRLGRALMDKSGITELHTDRDAAP